VTAAIVLVAAALLAGVGLAATPLLGGTPAGPLLSGLTDGAGDAGDLARDRGVPVPEVDVPPCLPTVRACVDLADDQAWLLDKGKIVRGPVAIIPGDDASPTPRGSFTVQWKAAEYTSRQFLVQMPWSVFFADGGVAFHEGDPDTYSAGCVKLDEDDAHAFFEYLQVGDPIQVV
jgi:L,D-transpeptidase catalytic domain